jgi:hypothetical protein
MFKILLSFKPVYVNMVQGEPALIFRYDRIGRTGNGLFYPKPLGNAFCQAGFSRPQSPPQGYYAAPVQRMGDTDPQGYGFFRGR